MKMDALDTGRHQIADQAGGPTVPATLVSKVLEKVMAVSPEVKDINPWREAIIDELVSCHIYVAKHDSDPRQAVHDIITWNQELALDPKVSKEAQWLVDSGRDLALRDQAAWQRDGYWRWQGDGNDEPESLTCHVVMSADQIRNLVDIEHKYRKLLWLQHGHSMLYGDDGEMQCGRCSINGGPWDYKRAPLSELEAAVHRADMARLASLARGHEL